MQFENLNLLNPVILIKVYDRYKHLKQCLESLESCNGVKNYEVIIGSDAAYKNNHLEKINEVRNYLRNKERNNSFKKLTVIYHKNNVGELENGRACHQMAEDLGFQTFIMMEDDVVVGKYFLDFMKNGLVKFNNYPNIVAINSFLDPALQIRKNEPFLYNMFSAYGFASWYKKWRPMQRKIENTNYSKHAISNFKMFRKLAKVDSNAKSFPFIAERFYRASDIEICLIMEYENLWVIVPPHSLSANRGLDGSGLRSGINLKLQAMQPYSNRIEYPHTLDLNKIYNYHVKSKVSQNDFLQNWISFLVYNYFPFGFKILKYLRSVKKSL